MELLPYNQGFLFLLLFNHQWFQFIISMLLWEIYTQVSNASKKQLRMGTFVRRTNLFNANGSLINGGWGDCFKLHFVFAYWCGHRRRIYTLVFHNEKKKSQFHQMLRVALTYCFLSINSQRVPPPRTVQKHGPLHRVIPAQTQAKLLSMVPPSVSAPPKRHHPKAMLPQAHSRHPPAT